MASPPVEHLHLWNLCQECAATIGASGRSPAYVRAVAELLLGTGAAESKFWYTRQTTIEPMSIRGGFSRWQVELETAWDLLLRARPVTLQALTQFIWPADRYPADWHRRNPAGPAWMLRGSDRAGVAFARLKYLSIPELVPTEGPEALAQYWKTYYNTALGAGTVEHFMSTWHQLCVPVLERSPS